MDSEYRSRTTGCCCSRLFSLVVPSIHSYVHCGKALSFQLPIYTTRRAVVSKPPPTNRHLVGLVCPAWLSSLAGHGRKKLHRRIVRCREVCCRSRKVVAPSNLLPSPSSITPTGLSPFRSIACCGISCSTGRKRGEGEKGRRGRGGDGTGGLTCVNKMLGKSYQYLG